MNSKTGIIPDEYPKAYIAYWYQLSLHTVSESRSVYTVLDWLGDIGGLFDALALIAGTLVSIVTGQMYQITLLSNIFVQRDSQEPQHLTLGNPNRIKTSPITVTWSNWFLEKVKHVMRCACKARVTVSDRLIKKSSDYIEK